MLAKRVTNDSVGIVTGRVEVVENNVGLTGTRSAYQDYLTRNIVERLSGVEARIDRCKQREILRDGQYAIVPFDIIAVITGPAEESITAQLADQAPMFAERPQPLPAPAPAAQAMRPPEGDETHPCALPPVQPVETFIPRVDHLAEEAAKQHGSLEQHLELAEVRSCPSSGQASGPATPTRPTEPVVVPETFAPAQQPIWGKKYHQFTKDIGNHSKEATLRSIAGGGILRTAQDAFNNCEDLTAQLLSMSTQIIAQHA